LRNVYEGILELLGVGARIQIGLYLVWTPKYDLYPFNSLQDYANFFRNLCTESIQHWTWTSTLTPPL